jgi:hypothetical protein
MTGFSARWMPAVWLRCLTCTERSPAHLASRHAPGPR